MTATITLNGRQFEIDATHPAAGNLKATSLLGLRRILLNLGGSRELASRSREELIQAILEDAV